MSLSRAQDSGQQFKTLAELAFDNLAFPAGARSIFTRCESQTCWQAMTRMQQDWSLRREMFVFALTMNASLDGAAVITKFVLHRTRFRGGIPRWSWQKMNCQFLVLGRVGEAGSRFLAVLPCRPFWVVAQRIYVRILVDWMVAHCAMATNFCSDTNRILRDRLSIF